MTARDVILGRRTEGAGVSKDLAAPFPRRDLSAFRLAG
jgi:hypothetical protein